MKIALTWMHQLNLYSYKDNTKKWYDVGLYAEADKDQETPLCYYDVYGLRLSVGKQQYAISLTITQN